MFTESASSDYIVIQNETQYVKLSKRLYVPQTSLGYSQDEVLKTYDHSQIVSARIVGYLVRFVTGKKVEGNDTVILELLKATMQYNLPELTIKLCQSLQSEIFNVSVVRVLSAFNYEVAINHLEYKHSEELYSVQQALHSLREFAAIKLLTEMDHSAKACYEIQNLSFKKLELLHENLLDEQLQSEYKHSEELYSVQQALHSLREFAAIKLLTEMDHSAKACYEIQNLSFKKLELLHENLLDEQLQSETSFIWTMHSPTFRSHLIPYFLKSFTSFFELLLLNEKLSDVIIVSGTERIKTHWVVLKTYEYFQSMEENPVLYLDDNLVPTLIFPEFIASIYQQELPLNSITSLSAAYDLLKIAGSFDLPKLLRSAKNYIKECVTPKNALNVLNTLCAKLPWKTCDEIVNYLLELVLLNIIDVGKTEEFKTLSLSKAIIIIAGARKVYGTEELGFELSRDWLLHDVLNRRQYVQFLFEDVVKLVNLSLEYFEVEVMPLVSTHVLFSDPYVQALFRNEFIEFKTIGVALKERTEKFCYNLKNIALRVKGSDLNLANGTYHRQYVQFLFEDVVKLVNLSLEYFEVEVMPLVSTHVLFSDPYVQALFRNEFIEFKTIGVALKERTEKFCYNLKNIALRVKGSDLNLANGTYHLVGFKTQEEFQALYKNEEGETFIAMRVSSEDRRLICRILRKSAQWNSYFYQAVFEEYDVEVPLGKHMGTWFNNPSSSFNDNSPMVFRVPAADITENTIGYKFYHE